MDSIVECDVQYNIMISEKLVCGIWQSPISTDLLTDQGEHFRKIYAGRPVSGPGCDFQDAIFAIDGRLMLGDVELHVDAREWYMHGHHRDNRYNNVALHVVMWHSGDIPTVLENGRMIPTVSLRTLMETTGDSGCQVNQNQPLLPARTCPAAQMVRKGGMLQTILAECGHKRFEAKADYFRTVQGENDAEQMLFRGIMGALGYSRNTSAFEKLADLISCETLKREAVGGRTLVVALMLGSAGLLECSKNRSTEKTNSGYYVELKRLWQRSGREPAMSREEWCLYGIRPGNTPLYRIEAAAELVMRYRKSGFLSGMLELLQAAPDHNYHAGLEEGLIVERTDNMRRKKRPALLGKMRAGEIVVNIILPYLYSYALAAKRKTLAEKALRLYSCYPATGQNYITRLMAGNLGVGHGASMNACSQQGLLYIFKTYCRHRACASCPVVSDRKHKK